MFNVLSVEGTDTAEVEMTHPISGRPLGWFVTLAGPEHPLHVAKIADRQRRMRVAMAIEGRDKVIERSLDEEAAHKLDLAITCTIAWRGAQWEGEEYPCTPDNVRKLYTRKNMGWIPQQIFEALTDRANFFTRSENG